MAQHATNEHTQDQPSHETQSKGVQNPQQNQGNADGSTSHNQPSHEAQAKGGQHSHSGGSKR